MHFVTFSLGWVTRSRQERMSSFSFGVAIIPSYDLHRRHRHFKNIVFIIQMCNALNKRIFRRKVSSHPTRSRAHGIVIQY